VKRGAPPLDVNLHLGDPVNELYSIVSPPKPSAKM
jgi:hypothetical protein